MSAPKKALAKKGRILGFLFGLPFAAFGLGFFFWNVLPAILDANTVQSWRPASAKILEAKLVSSISDGSTTYRATARYQYHYSGRSFTSDRVSVHSGGDNIGDFQENLGRRLERQHRRGEAIQVWVNPNNPSEAIIDREPRWGLLGFKLIFCVVFSAVGLGVIIYMLTAKVKLEFVVSDGAEPNQTEVMTHLLKQEDWAENQIRSNAKSGMWVIWGFAVFWNLISAPLWFVVPEEFEKGNTAALLGALFPIVGMWLIWLAIKKTREWRHFGHTILALDPFPGAIGGHVGGTILLNIPYQSEDEYQVTLNNVYSYMSGSGKNRSRSERVEWQDNQRAKTEWQAGGKQTLLTFRFDVPEGLNPSEEEGESYYKWELKLAANLEPLALERSFPIPVFVTSETSESITYEPSHVSHESQAAAVEQITNLKQIPGGVELYFKAGRNIGMAMATLLFGLIFGGAGIWLWSESAFMSIMFLLFGIPCTFGGFYIAINAFRVKIDQQGVQTIRYLCGLVAKRRSVERSRIKGIICKRGSQQRMGEKVTVFYNLFLKINGGKEIRIGESFTGLSQAEYAAEAIALLTGLTYLGKEDRVSLREKRRSALK